VGLLISDRITPNQNTFPQKVWRNGTSNRPTVEMWVQRKRTEATWTASSKLSGMRAYAEKSELLRSFRRSPKLVRYRFGHQVAIGNQWRTMKSAC
jgi:hypothetical protein